MTQPDPAGNRDALTASTGVVVLAVAGSGCTLAASTTYYFPLSLLDGNALASSHLMWSAAFAGTITIETSNYPRFVGGPDGTVSDVTDYSTTVGHWQPTNPSTAIVEVTGASNTATAATVTAGGAAAGACTFNLSELATKRARIKVVCTTAGLVRNGIHARGK